jgi:hypothetical protein
MKRKILILLLLLAIVFAYRSGNWLVLDQPAKADLIVVLAGETGQRPARGLELLRQGYAPRLMLDVPDDMVFQWTMVDLGRRYAEGLPEAGAVSVCPIHGLSTKAETADVSECLKALSAANRILLVTSDYHTRRGLAIFQRRMGTAHQFSVAAAYDAQQYGPQWWQHRQWAKTWLEEWLKFTWWKLVDRWS